MLNSSSSVTELSKDHESTGLMLPFCRLAGGFRERLCNIYQVGRQEGDVSSSTRQTIFITVQDDWCLHDDQRAQELHGNEQRKEQ